jgi:FtsH-binding integral membrane protein
MTLGITASIFGGASLMGFLLPKSYAMGYGTILGGSMLGLLGLNASGLLAGKFLGYTLYANTLSTAESYLGIGLFTMMIIYDTHIAIKRYQKGDADHLGMSIQLLLDLWYLIIRIATNLSKTTRK